MPAQPASLSSVFRRVQVTRSSPDNHSVTVSSPSPDIRPPVMRPSLIGPVVVLALFAALLPVRLPAGPPGASRDECLALSDTPARSNPGAQRQLEQCSWLYPDDATLLGDLAGTYERADATAQAETTYRRALAIDPDFAELRLRLGRLLLRRGAAAEARGEAEAALRVQPNRLALLDLLHASQRALDGGAR